VYSCEEAFGAPAPVPLLTAVSGSAGKQHPLHDAATGEPVVEFEHVFPRRSGQPIPEQDPS